MSLEFERDYGVRLMDLPPAVRSFVKRNDDYYTIVLNARHTWEQNRKSFRHEECHINGNDYEQDDADVVETNTHNSQKERKG